jgi:hypothetical protein
MTVLNPGAREIIEVGGVVFTNIRSLKILHTRVEGSSISMFYDASPNGTPGPYQVPSGKTFRLRAVRFHSMAATSNQPIASLMYSPTIAASHFNLGGGGTVLTLSVGMISGFTGPAGKPEIDAPTVNNYATTSPPVFEIAISGKAPALTYPHVYDNQSTWGQYTLYGYEE